MDCVIKKGDKVMVFGRTVVLQATVMAVVDNYAMVRYPRCVPFVKHINELLKDD